MHSILIITFKSHQNFLIEQSYSCTIRYFDRPYSFCELVTLPTKISDDTLAFLFNKCNLDYVGPICYHYLQIECRHMLAVVTITLHTGYMNTNTVNRGKKKTYY
jgi:hypothetical protein